MTKIRYIYLWQTRQIENLSRLMKSSIFYIISIIMIGFSSIKAMENEKTVIIDNKSDSIVSVGLKYPPIAAPSVFRPKPPMEKRLS